MNLFSGKTCCVNHPSCLEWRMNPRCWLGVVCLVNSLTLPAVFSQKYLTSFFFFPSYFSIKICAVVAS